MNKQELPESLESVRSSAWLIVLPLQSEKVNKYPFSIRKCVHTGITPEAEFPPMLCAASYPQHHFKNFAQNTVIPMQWAISLFPPPFFFFNSNLPHPFHASKIFVGVDNFTAAEGTGVPKHCLVVMLQTTALNLSEKPGKRQRAPSTNMEEN